MRISVLSGLAACLLLGISDARAQAPDSLGVQGFINDTGGNPVDSANVSVTFKLFKGADEVWSEVRTIDISNGSFDVRLGKVTPLDTVLFDRPMELSVKLDGEASEFTPRVNLAASAYALGLRGLRTARVTGAASQEGYNLIGGAENNTVADNVVGATISGGGGHDSGGENIPNEITNRFAVIGGGGSNTASGGFSTIGGGKRNFVGTSGIFAVIAGGVSNYITAGDGAVGGGERDSVTASHGFVGGGVRNRVDGEKGAIAGGEQNKAKANLAFVGGGSNNVASGANSVVSGGLANSATNVRATVGGGGSNDATGQESTIGGGDSNTATNTEATVGGGRDNTASGAQSTVAGGYLNTASAQYSAVGGGNANVAGGLYATIPGGRDNRADGWYSFAGGYGAAALHDNSFVWNDGSNTSDSLVTTGQDQFRVKANGGAWFFSGTDTTAGVYLAPGAGSWTDASSRDFKTDFKTVNARDILQKIDALEIGTWRYLQEPTGVTHLGPFAEEFHDAFGLGSTNRGITTVDANGVALAAIQELYRMVLDLQQENRRLLERLEEREVR